jgi:hypothetical protein
MEEILHSISHALLHSLKELLFTVPFLFLAYLLMEYIEHKASTKMEDSIFKVGKFGPFLGTGLGLIPQCGFSASCSNLYATGLLTEGTLIAVFIATSDEAIPLLLSKPELTNDIWKFIIVKVVFGILIGFMVDLMLKIAKIKKEPVELCEDCGCEEEGGIIKPALKHTLKTALFIFVVSLVLGIVMEFVGEDILHKVLLTDSYAQPFVASLLGLIPNCSVSVALIELYSEGVLSFGAACAGLCSGAGIGLAVLFKTNKSFKENMRIVGILYATSAMIGFFLMLFNVQ